VSPANETRSHSNSSFSIGRRQANFRSVNWGGDQPRHLVDPKAADRFAINATTPVSLDYAARRSTQRVQLPDGQMYHVTVDHEVPTTSTEHAGRRHHAGRRSRSEAPAPLQRSATLGSWARRLRVRITAPDPAGLEHRLVDLLRQQGDALTTTARRSRVGGARMDHLDRRRRTQSTAPLSAPLAIDPFDSQQRLLRRNVIFHTTARDRAGG